MLPDYRGTYLYHCRRNTPPNPKKEGSVTFKVTGLLFLWGSVSRAVIKVRLAYYATSCSRIVIMGQILSLPIVIIGEFKHTREGRFKIRPIARLVDMGVHIRNNMWASGHVI